MNAPSNDVVVRGHCLCGAIRFELEGAHNWVGHCHCDSCRRATGAPVVTFIGHPNGTWRWTGETPSKYTSSPGNYRHFCASCGSAVGYSSDRYPDEFHFHAVLLERPADLHPTEIYHADECLNWDLNLPR